jgi:hypothetical protein
VILLPAPWVRQQTCNKLLEGVWIGQMQQQMQQQMLVMHWTHKQEVQQGAQQEVLNAKKLFLHRRKGSAAPGGRRKWGSQGGRGRR